MGSRHRVGSFIVESDSRMKPGLTPEQRVVARLLFGLPEAAGYALAGGSAIVALGFVERLTRDLDAFVPASPGASVGNVANLAAALEVRLRADGWEVTEVRRHPTFCRLLVVGDTGSLEVDLAVDSPPMFDLVLVDGIPVLSPEDLAARKVLAVIDRAEGRDFTDLWALAHALGRETCVSLAMSLDSGIDRLAVAESFRLIERLADDELPCEPSARSLVRRDFEAWRAALSSPSCDP